MKALFSTLFILLVALLNVQAATDGLSIIPKPREMTVTAEGTLPFASLTSISYTDEDVKRYVTDFATQLEAISGIKLNVKESGEATDGEIRLSVDETVAAEGYTLTVGDNGISITASTKYGFFYALQTLKQMLPRAIYGNIPDKTADWSVPYVDIVDKPYLQHRGFHLDIARHFFGKEDVKRVLDIMAIYKMNRFHWHLTDDQGWRVEIPEYPLLTAVGAVRSGSFCGPGENGTKVFDDTEYGRGLWYTQDELREVVAYAKSLNIEIIPEIDMPGHMVAAITAYPEFSCDSTKKYSVRIDGGVSEDVLNVGDDRVIDFLKCVLDNIAGIFPYEYIHIGGDECPTTQWKTNKQCRIRVLREGLDGVEQLQQWLVEELGLYLKEKHGKNIVVWDELLSYWNKSNEIKPVIMAWNDIKKSREAADMKLYSIIVPHQSLYFDYMQVPAEKTFVDEIYHGGWDNVNTIEEAYAVNPVAELAGFEKYCLGVQGNLWTETCNNAEEMEYQMLPRLLAVAEVGWLANPRRKWDDFYTRLQGHDELFDAMGYAYGKHYIESEEPSDNESIMAEAQEILAWSVRGEVGYPAAEYHDALEAAFEVAQSTPALIGALSEAVEQYKSAEIKQPEPGKTYRIISASTYYKKQFIGSSIYAANNKVRLHITPQAEPEELWQFEAVEGGYLLRNMCVGKALRMPEYDATVTLGDEGTVVRVDKGSVPTGNHTYYAGVVTISEAEGYSPQATGDIKRLFGESSCYVHAYDNPSLCYSGTWRIVEVKDFAEQLAGLCAKCEYTLRTAIPDMIDQPKSEALDYLKNSVLLPARAALEEGGVTEEIYCLYLELYNKFLQMPRASLLDEYDGNEYYYIRNGHFTNYYAAYNSSNNQVVPMTKGSGDEYLWQIMKNSDGTACLYNKAADAAAYIESDAAGQVVKVGKEYPWTLKIMTVDTGKSGVCIIGTNNATSWYINPGVFGNVVAQPFWGACIWSLEASGINTGIEEITDKGSRENIIYYDLQGRAVEHPAKGFYITNNGKKIIVGE